MVLLCTKHVSGTLDFLQHDSLRRGLEVTPKISVIFPKFLRGVSKLKDVPSCGICKNLQHIGAILLVDTAAVASGSLAVYVRHRSSVLDYLPIIGARNPHPRGLVGVCGSWCLTVGPQIRGTDVGVNVPPALPPHLPEMHTHSVWLCTHFVEWTKTGYTHLDDSLSLILTTEYSDTSLLLLLCTSTETFSCQS